MNIVIDVRLDERSIRDIFIFLNFLEVQKQVDKEIESNYIHIRGE